MDTAPHPNTGPPTDGSSVALESGEALTGPPASTGRPHPGASLPATRVAPAHRRRSLFPLSVRAWLAIAMVLPLAAAVVLASAVVSNQMTRLRQANAANQSTLTLDSLVRAQVDLFTEYVPSEAIVAARAYHLSTPALDKLLGADVQAELAASRRAVDSQPVFEAGGAFAGDRVALDAVRRSIDRGQATQSSVETVYNRLRAAVGARWVNTFARLRATSQGDSPVTTARLASLDLAFNAYTTGLEEENPAGGGSLENVLTAGSTPTELRGIIAANQQYTEAVAGFPGALGPEAAAAWHTFTTNRLSVEISQLVNVAIVSGLNDRPPAFDNSAAISSIARSELEWSLSLPKLVLASSADLRAATAVQTRSATRDLWLAAGLMGILLLATAAALLAMSRAIRRPLARMVSAATSVREGELELPPLDESGPRELSLAAGAFNDMASTLRAVQEQAIALSRGDLDDPVLEQLLPGRTGHALQASLNELQRSVRRGENQRLHLAERATRDSLTGLLNRGAALEALDLNLAAVRRSRGQLALTLFFIDLDQLKQVNDTYGHDAGDSAIVAVADAMRATTRASDVIARFGGDEFVVGWLGDRGSTAPLLLGKLISERVASSEIEGLTHVTLGCSIGVAVSEPSDETVAPLLERADRALYMAKADGRGKVRWYGSD